MDKESPMEVLAVNDLVKRYQIYKKPSDRLWAFFSKNVKCEEYCAINNVSLSLFSGRTLGVIGENGAGKSTLLKLITGTLSPTSGAVTVKGKAFGLLELGVGFHPGFTGRQNIFFYSDILGISRDEVRGKLQDIIRFSELGKFIDRPIKTYSTGMRMRLAFSLVASLEPDILIIDEALSVGDLHFQKKCIDRILEFKMSGKSIIFCSHSMYQVSRLCDDVIWLGHGEVRMQGAPQEVIPAYEHYQLQKDSNDTGEIQKASDSKGSPAVIEKVELLSERPLKSGCNLAFRISIKAISSNVQYHVSLSLKIENGWGIHVTGTHLRGMEPLRGKNREVIVTFPGVPLSGGIFLAHARVFDNHGVMVYDERTSEPFEIMKEAMEFGICHFENRWEIH